MKIINSHFIASLIFGLTTFFTIFGAKAFELSAGKYRGITDPYISIEIRDSSAIFYQQNGLFVDEGFEDPFENIFKVDSCNLIPVGCGIYEITGCSPLGVRVFKDVSVEQKNISSINSDSVQIVFIFEQDAIGIPNRLEIHSCKDITIPISANELTIRIPKECKGFNFSLKPTDMYARINGRAFFTSELAYPKRIKIEQNLITIKIPFYNDLIFYQYDIRCDYLRVIDKDVIKWQGLLFKRVK